MKVTVAPGKGLLLASLTMTASGLANSAPALADCVPPELTAIKATVEFTERIKLTSAVNEFSSVTLMVTILDPEMVGAPEMMPVAEAMDKPLGKPVADQLYGAAPPVAVTTAL